jgi:ABC-type transporter Mla maintaining outer membrane lipid asymmetry ATPase subunit MlaF
MRDVSVAAMRDQSRVVLREINWTAASGEYWVVAGLQGSGKSDFLAMTASLMGPAAGQYLLFGEEMPIFDEARLKTRLRLGLVFETGQLFNHLTVSENIALPLRYHNNLTKVEAAPQVQPVLEALELEPWADSTPGALGRPWQKRVGLARALVLRPEVLLVDSPLTGLDLRHSSWWLAFLEQLSKGHPLLGGRRLTLVVTTADVRPWSNRAVRFAIIRDERFHVMGEWERLEAERHGLAHELFLTDAQRRETATQEKAVAGDERKRE